MTLLSRDEAIDTHTRSLIRTAAVLHDVALRGVATVLAGHRTRHHLSPTQHQAARTHRRVLATIAASGHGDVLADNLAGFLSAYASDPGAVVVSAA